MKGYKIYLTKSKEVAGLIARARSLEMSENNIKSISTGSAHDDKRIPGLYHNDGWYYTIIEV